MVDVQNVQTPGWREIASPRMHLNQMPDPLMSKTPFVSEMLIFKEQRKSDFSSVMNMTAGECVAAQENILSLFFSHHNVPFSGLLFFFFSCFAFNVNIQVSVPLREIYSGVLGERFHQNVLSIIKNSIFIYSSPFFRLFSLLSSSS